MDEVQGVRRTQRRSEDFKKADGGEYQHKGRQMKENKARLSKARYDMG